MDLVTGSFFIRSFFYVVTYITKYVNATEILFDVQVNVHCDKFL